MSGLRKLAVSPQTAGQMLGVGLTKVYELLNAGELESFHIGRARRIPVKGIEKFIEREMRAARDAEINEQAKADIVSAARKGL